MTRAKFKCNSVTLLPNGAKSVDMSPVVSGSVENLNFWKFTPSGKLDLYCVNANVQFEPGKEYYVDISEVEVVAAPVEGV